MYKAILLDLDGVIRHWDNQGISNIETEHGIATGSFFEYAFAEQVLLPTITGKMSHIRWIELIKNNMSSQMDAHIIEQLVETWVATPYTIDIELVEAVKFRIRSAKLVLVTNATNRLTNDLQSTGLLKFLDVVINSSDIGYAKPDKRFFENALDTLGLKPQDSLLIDDSLGNVQAAVKMGIEAIHFENKEQTLATLDYHITNKSSGPAKTD